MGRWMRRLAGVVAVLGVGIVVVWVIARPATPDAFYDTPEALPATPGVLLRQEVFTRQVPKGARAWRILYSTTRADGAPAVASALVMAAPGDDDAPRPVIAWAHGTTGVMPGCAPSLLGDPFVGVPALPELLARGWLYVAPDYTGLGTAGPHPYLIGEAQARSVLDALRALRGMDVVEGDDAAVVWGHSQGGHAALWTGILAPDYAPELTISGIAAVAPASDLAPLIDSAQHSLIGRVLSSYVLQAYGAAYEDVRAERPVRAEVAWLARDLAGRCMDVPAALVSMAPAWLARGTLFREPPGRGALGRRLAENSPTAPVPQPLLIAQGAKDDLVLLSIQEAFVAARCADGQALDYRRYAEVDHLTVVAPDSPLVPDLVAWTAARFEGQPASSSCPEAPDATP